MSYITDIQTIYGYYKSLGTFGYQSEFEQDSAIRNVAQANFPICFISDNTTGAANFTASGDLTDIPNFTIYFLTKFDATNTEVSKDTAKATKHTKLVEPMKVLGFSVLWEYFRTNNVLSSDVNLNYVELIDWGTADLSGVKITVNFSRYLQLSCIPS